MISFLCNRLAEFIIAKKIKSQSDEKIVEVFMETFIFNCYKKWLKERNGSFFKATPHKVHKLEIKHD